MADGTPRYPADAARSFQAPDQSAARLLQDESTLSILNIVYSQEAQRLDSFDPEQGIGRYTVPHALTSRLQNMSYLNGLSKRPDGSEAGVVDYTLDHAPGHFRPEIGTVVPGVAAIRSSYETLARSGLKKEGYPEDFPSMLTGFNSIRFKNAVLPGNRVLYVPSNIQTDTELFSGEIRGDITGQTSDKETIEIKGLRVMVPDHPTMRERVLPGSELFEVGAHALLAHMFSGRDQELLDDQGMPRVLPLFVGLGETEIYQNVFAGDELEVYTDIKRPLKALTGVVQADIRIVRGQELILTSSNVTGMSEWREKALQKFGLSSGQAA